MMQELQQTRENPERDFIFLKEYNGLSTYWCYFLQDENISQDNSVLLSIPIFVQGITYFNVDYL